ncbi:MAG: DUF4118 domain-containing protein [Chthoniobacterales bacterium]|nr:DUF4118 domain-containing protein [Chthoniobacterales bacterium]
MRLDSLREADRAGSEGDARVKSASAKEYAMAAVGVSLVTLACWLLTAVTGYGAIALIFLLGVVLAGMVLRRGPVLLVAALSAVSWNFLFIPPLFTLHIAKFQDALMFATYFVVAIAIGSLTSRLRAREQWEREREQRATALYRFAQKLAAAPSLEMALTFAADHINELLGVTATIFTQGNVPYGGRVFPIKNLTTSFGSLQVKRSGSGTLTSNETQLLEAFADQLATVIERERLKQIAAQAQLTVEAERLRKTLLDCVSHELKTPIAAIAAASQELQRNPELSRQLANEIQHGSRRLNRVVNNLLDMTRLESGVVQPKLEWCDVLELLQGAIEAEEEALRGHEIHLSVSEDFPLALLDHSLLEQALAKLLANAGSYTPTHLPIDIAAGFTNEQLILSVCDRGPGLPEDAERVFEKFYRANGSKTGGLGLGLSIARGFVEAHGGKLTALNRETGGACFTVALPVQQTERSALETVS